MVQTSTALICNRTSGSNSLRRETAGREERESRGDLGSPECRLKEVRGQLAMGTWSEGYVRPWPRVMVGLVVSRKIRVQVCRARVVGK